jgi:NAD(P)H-flavin reductase/hemoglobin-like flavoprotein
MNLLLIKDSFALIEPVAEEFSTYFHSRLFIDNPRLRGMFPAAMDSHGDHFFGSITRIVWSLDNPRALAAYLAQLGRDHRKFGVTAAHYAAVCEALLAAIRHFTGATRTDEVHRAWQAALGQVAKIMIEGAERGVAGEPPWWLGEVLLHRKFGPDVAVLTVRPNQPLTYQAGQYVSVQCARWPRVWRRFSIANAPRSDGLLRFHIRAIPGGWVSGALVHHTGPGDTLLLGPAAGTMVAQAESERDVLCVAGGTGLAPIKAIVEQFIAQSEPGVPRNIHLFFGARRENDLYDLPSLRRMQSGYPSLRVIPVVSAEDGFAGLRGALPSAVAGYRSWAEHDVYVSGPVEMVRNTILVLMAVGIPATRIHNDPVGTDG